MNQLNEYDQKEMLWSYFKETQYCAETLTSLEYAAIFECLPEYEDAYNEFLGKKTNLGKKNLKDLMVLDRKTALSKLSELEHISLYDDFKEFCVEHQRQLAESRSETYYD